MTAPEVPRRRAASRGGPTARRLALAITAVALLTSVAVLVAAAVQQSRKVAETGRLAAPTRPPLPMPAAAESAPLRGARRLSPTPPSALGAVPPGLPARNAGAAAGLPPASLPQAPPPTLEPPRPTPTPQLVASLTCRKGIRFDVKPETALVTINGEPVGEAGRWEDEDDALELPRPGVYYVRLSCRGCRTAWFKVTVDPHADDRVVKIKLRNED